MLDGNKCCGEKVSKLKNGGDRAVKQGRLPFSIGRLGKPPWESGS